MAFGSHDELANVDGFGKSDWRIGRPSLELMMMDIDVAERSGSDV